MFKDNQDKLNEFVRSVISLLNAILEGNFNKKIIQFMADNLDAVFLLQLLKNEYENFIQSNRKKDKESESSVLTRMNSKDCWPEEIVEAFPIYFLINVINESTGKWKKYLLEMDKDVQNAYSFFEKNSAHIEIMFKNKIEKYHFVVQPAC